MRPPRAQPELRWLLRNMHAILRCRCRPAKRAATTRRAFRASIRCRPRLPFRFPTADWPRSEVGAAQANVEQSRALADAARQSALVTVSAAYLPSTELYTTGRCGPASARTWAPNAYLKTVHGYKLGLLSTDRRTRSPQPALRQARVALFAGGVRRRERAVSTAAQHGGLRADRRTTARWRTIGRSRQPVKPRRSLLQHLEVRPVSGMVRRSIGRVPGSAAWFDADRGSRLAAHQAAPSGTTWRAADSGGAGQVQQNP